MKVVWDKFKKVFEDKETGKEYRRIMSGIGWPYDKPGFLVVITEDAEEDFSLVGHPRHLHVVEEFESYVMEELYRSGLKWGKEYLFDSVLGNHENVNRNMWDLCRQEDDPRLTIKPPALEEKLSMVFLRQIVKKMTTAPQKTLHFGEDSTLAGHLHGIASTADMENIKLEQYPALAALGNVLIEAELGRVGDSGGGFRPVRRRYK
ncbi:MAG: hypothetical protein K9J85_05305 [Desulfobacteraceae bacterium]|nr:hypothetical protein [Desulfobacteraceae bacterium]